jgi:hypothetical protein
MILKEAQKKQAKPTIKIAPVKSIPKLCHILSQNQRRQQQDVGV